MISKSLLSEKAMFFVALESGGTTGNTFNGEVAGSTTALPMLQKVASSGKGIDVTGYNRAFVLVQSGAASAVATIKCYASAGTVKADDDSMTELVLSSAVTLAADTDHTYRLIELDLRGAKHTLSTTSSADNNRTWLWVNVNQDGTTTSAIVILSDPQNEPAVDAVGAVTATDAYYPAAIIP